MRHYGSGMARYRHKRDPDDAYDEKRDAEYEASLRLNPPTSEADPVATLRHLAEAHPELNIRHEPENL